MLEPEISVNDFAVNFSPVKMNLFQGVRVKGGGWGGGGVATYLVTDSKSYCSAFVKHKPLKC